MACKFKYGDRVIANGHKGTVVSIVKDHNNYVCRVKFDNRFLIPSEMNFEECYIDYEGEYQFKPKHMSDYCPICSTKWTITKFNNKVWKDCLKCNKKEEDCIEEFQLKNNKRKETNTKSDENDLYEEFATMLGGNSGDDWDDDWF